MYNAVDVSGDTNSVDLDISADMTDVSVLATTSKQYIPSQDDATISLKAFWSLSVTGLRAKVEAELTAGQTTAKTLVFTPQGAGVGNITYTQTVYVKSYKTSAGVGGALMLDVQFQRTGATTIGAAA